MDVRKIYRAFEQYDTFHYNLCNFLIFLFNFIDIIYLAKYTFNHFIIIEKADNKIKLLIFLLILMNIFIIFSINLIFYLLFKIRLISTFLKLFCV